MNEKWFPQNNGCIILINAYGADFPTATLVSCDIETNGLEITDPNFKIVCLGLSEDGQVGKIYFDIRPKLIDYLRSVQFIVHNGKEAEIPWLDKVYGGFSIEQIAFDTMTMAYTFDSSRRQYGLKKLLLDIFGLEYPTYNQMVTCSEYIALSCQEYPNLIEKTKTGKEKFPKKLSLNYFPQEVIAAYNGADVLYTWKLWEYYKEHFDAKQWNFFNTIEMPTTRLLYLMETLGIKIDISAVRRIHNETSKERRKAKKELILQAGKSFNPNSPKQVLSIFRGNGIDVTATDEGTISKYVGNPIVDSLLNYRGLQKVCSTYTIPLYFNAIKSSESRIHARFNQNTITGRLSSSDPINLQNQPQATRQCFVAKDGYTFVNADFSNIELRLPAHFSGEPGFCLELCKPHGDLHTKTANFLFETDITKLVSDDERKEKRAKAKTCNFLLTNSGTANRLAGELQVDHQEAEHLYRQFWSGYPTMATWLKEEKFQARKAGGIETYFGRWVNLPQLKLWCGRSNCAEICKHTHSFCKACFQREEAEREAISIRVQGTAADLVKLSALRLYQEHGLIPVVSVHDELMYEISLDKAEKMSYTIKEVMENIVQLRVPIVADVGIGLNWKEAKGK